MMDSYLSMEQLQNFNPSNSRIVRNDSILKQENYIEKADRSFHFMIGEKNLELKICKKVFIS